MYEDMNKLLKTKVLIKTIGSVIITVSQLGCVI